MRWVVSPHQVSQDQDHEPAAESPPQLNMGVRAQPGYEPIMSAFCRGAGGVVVLLLATGCDWLPRSTFAGQATETYTDSSRVVAVYGLDAARAPCAGARAAVGAVPVRPLVVTSAGYRGTISLGPPVYAAAASAQAWDSLWQSLGSTARQPHIDFPCELVVLISPGTEGGSPIQRDFRIESARLDSAGQLIVRARHRFSIAGVDTSSRPLAAAAILRPSAAAWTGRVRAEYHEERY